MESRTARNKCPRLLPLTVVLKAILFLNIVPCVFSWTITPRDLLEYGDILQSAVEDYLLTERERLDNIRSILSRLRTKIQDDRKTLTGDQGRDNVDTTHSVPTNVMNVEEFIGHPVNALLTIRAWKDIKEISRDKRVNHNRMMWNLTRTNARMPPQNTLTKMIYEVIQLQRIYLIPTSDFISGHVLGKQSTFNLTADDMMNIGFMADEYRLLDLAADWCAHALVHADDKTKISVDEIVDHLLSRVKKLIDIGAISSDAALELERWIYVHNRDANRRKAVAEGILTTVRWTGDIDKTLRGYKGCAETVNNMPDVYVIENFLTDDKSDSLRVMGRALIKLALKEEAMGLRVVHSLLTSDQLQLVNSVLEDIAIESGLHDAKYTPLITNSIDNKRYSFTIKYDVSALEANQYTIETDSYGEERRKTVLNSKGLHVILFLSDNAGGAVTWHANPSVAAQKNQYLGWYSDNTDGSKASPIFCPVLFGDRWLVHVHFGDL